MKRNAKLFLEDILESITRIEEYSSEITEKEFYDNYQTQDAILRRLEIIGEAVKNIPEEFKEKFPDIPWRQVAGFRDVLIHGYFGINLRRVWKVIAEDLYTLKEDIMKIRDSI